MRRCLRSQMRVPQRCRRCHAHSSIPIALGVGPPDAVPQLTARSNVSRPTGIMRRDARAESARRPRTRPRSRIRRSSRAVRRAEDPETAGDSGSVKVRRGQASASQRKRRTSARSPTARPRKGRSSRRRRWALCTWSERLPQVGHRANRSSDAPSRKRRQRRPRQHRLSRRAIVKAPDRSEPWCAFPANGDAPQAPTTQVDLAQLIPSPATDLAHGPEVVGQTRLGGLRQPWSIRPRPLDREPVPSRHPRKATATRPFKATPT